MNHAARRLIALYYPSIYSRDRGLSDNDARNLVPLLLDRRLLKLGSNIWVVDSLRCIH